MDSSGDRPGSERVDQSGSGLAGALAGFALLSAALCAGVAWLGGEGETALILGRNGVCDTATVVFYLVALALLVREGVTQLSKSGGVRSLVLLGGMAGLALFMAGEEVRWGLPVVLSSSEQEHVLSVHQAVGRVLAASGQGRTVFEAALVAGVRLALILGLFYGAFFAWRRRRAVYLWLSLARTHPAFLMMVIFAAGIVCSSTLYLSGFSSGLYEGLQQWLEMNASVAFLMACFSLWPRILSLTRADSHRKEEGKRLLR